LPASRFIAYALISWAAYLVVFQLFIAFVDGFVVEALKTDNDKSLERLEARSFEIDRWERFRRIRQGGLEFRYFYVRIFTLKFVNWGYPTYNVADFRLLDLVISFSKNVGTNRNPALAPETVRIPHNPACSDAVAPCWRVISITAISEPSLVEVAEAVDPFISSSYKGIWNTNEVLAIEVRMPRSFTLVQVRSGGNLVGGQGWVYATTCTPTGLCSKPLNLLGQKWVANEEVIIEE
jgi:hypothetical protein